MTYYEYAETMQEQCFKISQAHKVLGEVGLYDFYTAASEGYEEARKKLSVKEAQEVVDEELMQMLEATTAYVKEVQQQAAEKLDQEITE